MSGVSLKLFDSNQNGPRAYFKYIEDEYQGMGIGVHGKFESLLINLFSKISLCKHTLVLKDYAGKSWCLNRNSSIKWILKYDPTAQKADLQKMK